MKQLLIAIFLLILNFKIHSQKVYTPQAGTPERKAILDALRPKVEDKVLGKVKFVVSTFKISNDWAFVNGRLQKPDGTEFKEEEIRRKYGIDIWDNNFQALMKKVKGKWTVVFNLTGCTDVCWVGWDTEYKAPREIMPYN